MSNKYNRKKVTIGIDDMWTTAPETAKLLANPEDGYKYKKQSNKRADFKCPICGNIIKDKIICTIYHNGLFCPKCSDNIPYPEKFMYNLLNELGVDFEYQKKFKWCKYVFKGRNKTGRYDFYIPLKRIIIETDGGLGHGNKDNISGQTKEESKYIDNEKDILANIHNIRVIRIDCNYKHSDRFIYIKDSIFKNKLFCNMFDIENIDFNQIDYKSQKSVSYDICKYKRLYPNSTSSEIGKHFNLCINTIINYLKRGNEYGWCNYDAKFEHQRTREIIAEKRRRKVICITTGKIYSSILDAEKEFNITHIHDCCNNKRNYAGKLFDGTPLVWMYYDRYLKSNIKLCTINVQDFVNNNIKNSRDKICKSIICITTNKIYNSLTDAAIDYNLDVSSISKCCRHIQKSCGKDVNGNKLIWMFEEEYDKLKTG